MHRPTSSRTKYSNLRQLARVKSLLHSYVSPGQQEPRFNHANIVRFPTMTSALHELPGKNFLEDNGLAS